LRRPHEQVLRPEHLLEQASIHDDKKTVQQLLKESGNVQVTRFVRYKVGEA
jgi:translation elongation factor EF-Ts